MENKIAVITGGTSGIGAAYAKRFAKEGYDLILTGRRKEKIEETANQIRKETGAIVSVILAELSLESGISKVAEFIKEKNVEILVNNAGFGVVGYYQQTDLSLMEQLAKVNVLAPMELIRTVLPGMIERGKGTIINISSDGIYMIVPRNAVYSASKAFLKTLTEGLNMDLMGTGVRVIAVCPGLTHTDFHEKMGMDKSRQTDNGSVKWIEPEAVVTASLKDLDNGKIISIPSFSTRAITFILNRMPRNSYYKFMYQFSRKHFNKSK